MVLSAHGRRVEPLFTYVRLWLALIVYKNWKSSLKLIDIFSSVWFRRTCAKIISVRRDQNTIKPINALLRHHIQELKRENNQFLAHHVFRKFWYRPTDNSYSSGFLPAKKLPRSKAVWQNYEQNTKYKLLLNKKEFMSQDSGVTMGRRGRTDRPGWHPPGGWHPIKIYFSGWI